MYGKNLKLVLMVMLLLVSKSTFSQVTERERPKEWSQLVKGARFMDRFLPMKGNQLSSDTWGTSDVRPRYVDNGIEDRIWSYNDYVRIKNESGTSHVTFKDYRTGGATIDWTTVEPFCKVDDLIYFIEIRGKKPQISVDGKVYTCKLNKQQKAGKLNVCVLSYEKGKTAYKIDGKLLYAKNGGILYKSDSCIVEEVWTKSPVIAATVTEVKKADAPRVVPMGRQAVAAQPVEEDFAKAAVYTINYDTSGINNYDNLFLRINYRGDVARVYADGRLVADNFWNGKEMWVRMADLVGKKVELKILPLRKDAPVYFQKEQKAMIEAAKGDYMLGLDSVEVIERHTLEFNDAF